MIFAAIALTAELLILNVPASDTAAVGTTVPLVGDVPAHWMVADGTPLPCSQFPKLCAADPGHVAGGQWVANLTGMVVQRGVNTRRTRWIVKVE